MALVNPEPTVYLAGDLLKGSNNQSIYCRTKEEKEAELNEEMEDPFDALEVFQLIRHIRDPEHPLTLEELRVVTPDLINVDTQKKIVRVEFVPTVPHCSLTSLIGLCITLELSRTLPAYYKIDVSVAPGSHLQEEQVNQQLGDKERVAAAMENPNLLKEFAKMDVIDVDEEADVLSSSSSGSNSCTALYGSVPYISLWTYPSEAKACDENRCENPVSNETKAVGSTTGTVSLHVGSESHLSLEVDRAAEQPSSEDSNFLGVSSPISRLPSNSNTQNPYQSRKSTAAAWGTEEVYKPGLKRSKLERKLKQENHPKQEKRAKSAFLLSDEQKHVIDVVLKGRRSVFITGGAGTGKSFLLRALVEALPQKTTYVTATTGIAALQLGGSTLHSFAGCGIVHPGERKASVYARLRQKSLSTWRRCEVLVIDEVSMLDASFFDCLEYLARRARNSEEPFGGIQLVFSGDFLQLPPVVHSSLHGPSAESRYCFLSRAWLRCNPKVCVLTKSFRQKSQTFFNLLHEVRRGQMSEKSIRTLEALSTTTVSRESPSPDKIKGGKEDVFVSNPVISIASLSVNSLCPLQDCKLRGGDRTFLRPKRVDVERENDRFYHALTTPEYFYDGFHEGEGRFPKDLPQCLRLRKGCRVMLNKNLDVASGFVNGSCGIVVGFFNYKLAHEKLFSDHFSRMDAIQLCQAGSSEAGRGKQHYQLPIVAFEVGSGHGGAPIYKEKVIIEPNEWTEIQGTKVVSRSVQLPLIVAFAITVHKSQGMSLSLVDIDLSKAFEVGQAYVALSRCTDLKGIRLQGFNPAAIMTSSVALSYYEAIQFLAFQEWKKKAFADYFFYAFSCWPCFNPDDINSHKEPTVSCRASPTHAYVSRSSGCLVSEDEDGFPLPPSGYICPRDIVHEEDEENKESEEDAEVWNASHQRETMVDSFMCRPALSNEAVCLERWRCRIGDLLSRTEKLRLIVQRHAIPFEEVRNKRIILDIESCYHFFWLDCILLSRGENEEMSKAHSILMENKAAIRLSGSLSSLWNSFAFSNVEGSEQKYEKDYCGDNCTGRSDPLGQDAEKRDNPSLPNEKDHIKAMKGPSSFLAFSHQCCVERGNMLRIPRVVLDFLSPSFFSESRNCETAEKKNCLNGVGTTDKNTMDNGINQLLIHSLSASVTVNRRSNCLESDVQSRSDVETSIVRNIQRTSDSNPKKIGRDCLLNGFSPLSIVQWFIYLQNRMDLDIQRCPKETWKLSLLSSFGGKFPLAWEVYRSLMLCFNDREDTTAVSSTSFGGNSPTIQSNNMIAHGHNDEKNASDTLRRRSFARSLLSTTETPFSHPTVFAGSSPKMRKPTSLRLNEFGSDTNIDREFAEYYLHNGPPERTSFSHEEVLRYALYLQEKEREARAEVKGSQAKGESSSSGPDVDGTVLCTSSLSLAAAALALKLEVTFFDT